MNKLFNKGDYVLLSDCKEFDEKYGLKKDTTIWAVARKMEGGEPKHTYMERYQSNICVGISLDVGLWTEIVKTSYATKLSVEDVLYRSEDGLTLDELSKIAGAFEDGKEYECVVGNKHEFTSGGIYFANVNGVLDDNGDVLCRSKSTRFKPVTPKKQWVPSIGDEVIVHNDNDFEISYGKECLGKKVIVMSVFKDGEVTVAAINYEDTNYCFVLSMLKPINKAREAIIKKVTDLSETLDDSYSPRDFAIALYDAGLLKR
jgi:hypothetical protein